MNIHHLFIGAVLAPLTGIAAFDLDQLTNWAGAGVEGRIQDYARQIEFTDHGGTGDGLTDNAEALQTLVNSLAEDSVILFGEGDYLFTKGIDFSAEIHNHGIILRGAGPDRTRLIFETTEASWRGQLNVFGYETETESTVSATGKRRVIVDDPSGFAVGDDVVLYQDNNLEEMATSRTSGGNPGIQDEALDTWAEETTGQLFRVARIAGNVIITTREIRLDFTWPNQRLRKLVLRTGVGFEDLTVDNRTNLDGLHSIKFTRSANGWVRNVRSIRTVRYHVSTAVSRNLTIRDSWFFDAFRFGGGGHGYGVVVERYTSDCLVLNNVFQRLRHAMVAKEGANGNVFAYNFAFEGNQEEAPIAKDLSIHGHYPFKNLFEGNVVEFIHCTDWWGPAGPGNTFFRNRVTRMPIRIEDRSNGQILIANELVAGGLESSVQIDGTVEGTILLANVSPLVLPQDLEQLGALDLPASLWTRTKPVFWPDELPWPAFGPPNLPGTDRIPSQIRAIPE